jgi:TolB-like protein/Tfp pilus assembly protein PilF
LAAGLLTVLAVAGGLLWSTYADRGPEAIPGDAASAVPWFAGAPAIAVLPFDNFSGDPDQEYFVDGMTDQLITLLSNWGDFPVIARNSTFTYKGRTVDVRDVGRELGARYIVEGRVSKAGDRVRISAQLTDGTTGHNVWAKTYDRELEDLFAVQDEIAESIVAALYPELIRTEHERAAGHKSKDLASYDLLMRGYWHQFQQTQGDTAKARAFFERAIELEPSYAAAWAGLSFAHGQELQWTDDPARSLEARDRAARRCVALNSENAVCSLALGGALFQSGETSKALSALQRSIELNPNFSYAHAVLGAVLVVLRRPEEGIAHLERALRLDSKNPGKAQWLDGMSTAHFAAGHYEEAVDWAKQSIQINPDSDSSYRSLAVGYAQLGRIDEARAAVAEALRIDPDLTLEKVKRQRLDFGLASDFIEREIDALRKAGLPEE